MITAIRFDIRFRANRGGSFRIVTGDNEDEQDPCDITNDSITNLGDVEFSVVTPNTRGGLETLLGDTTAS